MNKKIAHTAELIANIRSAQTDTIAALTGVPTGETISRTAFSPFDTQRKRSRPARARPVTTRASSPSTALYQRRPMIAAGYRSRDVTQSYYELTRQLKRQRYRHNAFIALLIGTALGLGLTLI